jgi:mxaC protein
LSNTDVGRALIAAIEQFDGRPYSGSRIVLLVSDGGTHISEATRQRIRAGLDRNRVALYWLYLRSYNSQMLDAIEAGRESSPEVALHRFFQTLRTPYRLYQAEVPEDLARAVADVGRQQNLPLDFFERIPRADYSRIFVAMAALACLMLLIGRLISIRSWS